MKTNLALVAPILISITGCQLTSAQSIERRNNYDPLNAVLLYAKHEARSKYVYLRSSLVNHRDRPVKLSLEMLDGTIRYLETADMSQLELPLLTPEQAQETTLVCRNCKDDIYILQTFEFKEPPQRIDYDELFIALHDQNQLAEILSGAPNWLRKEFDTLWIFFYEPAKTRIIDSNGTTIDEYFGQEQLIKIDRKLLERNIHIAFSAPVQSILMLN